MIFSFYWAPWLSQIYLDNISQTTDTIASTTRSLMDSNITVSSVAIDELPASSPISSQLPLILIYSTLMTTAMIGHYLHTLVLPTYGNDYIFQVILSISLGTYFLTAFSTTLGLSSLSTMYILALIVQLCSGAYWPSVGFLRGKYILPEIRSVVIFLTRFVVIPFSSYCCYRVLSFFLVFILLWFYGNSPIIVFLGCGVLHILAIYSLFVINQMETKHQRTVEFNDNDF